MSDKRDALSRKLSEKQKALLEIRDASNLYQGTAEVAGDWSERKAALAQEISNIKVELAALDDNSDGT